MKIRKSVLGLVLVLALIATSMLAFVGCGESQILSVYGKEFKFGGQFTSNWNGGFSIVSSQVYHENEDVLKQQFNNIDFSKVDVTMADRYETQNWEGKFQNFAEFKEYVNGAAEVFFYYALKKYTYTFSDKETSTLTVSDGTSQTTFTLVELDKATDKIMFLKIMKGTTPVGSTVDGYAADFKHINLSINSLPYDLFYTFHFKEGFTHEGEELTKDQTVTINFQPQFSLVEEK